jgi:hypothetical protein
MGYKTQLICKPFPQSGLLGHYPDTSDRDTNNTDENIDDAEDHNKQVRQISFNLSWAHLSFYGT